MSKDLPLSKMKLKFPKYIQFGSYKFKVIEDKKLGGGNFKFADNKKSGELTIGTYYIKTQPDIIFSSILHECLELWFEIMDIRHKESNGNYIFMMNHKEYNIALDLASQSVLEFYELN